MTRIAKHESQKSKQTRALRILAELEVLYPDATTELSHKNPFELLIATILAAQATDKGVNAATPKLFEHYPDAKALASVTPEEIEPYIKTIGLYRNKAKNIVKASEQLVAEHNGKVPNDFEALIKLAGVGQKTANVVLANAYGRPAIAVDTHVGRLSRRLGFSKEKNPDKVETDLNKIFPEDTWIFLHHALILHGRRVCGAKKPHCEECTLKKHCPSYPLD